MRFGCETVVLTKEEKGSVDDVTEGDIKLHKNPKLLSLAIG